MLNAGTDREQVLPSKFPYRKAAAGERLLLIAPSGGGYGDPAERDPAAVRDDVVDGYVTAGGCPGLEPAVSRHRSATGSTGHEGTDDIEAMVGPAARRRDGRRPRGVWDDDDEGAATTDAAGADLERAQSQLDAFKAEPQFEAPGPAVDAAACRGQERRDRPGVEQRPVRDRPSPTTWCGSATRSA